MDARKIVVNTISNGGATVGWDDHVPSEGYMVSVYPKLARVIPLTQFDSRTVSDFIEDCAHILSRERHYLGTWVEDNDVHLDISVCEPSLSTALMLARRWEQLAVFDLDMSQTIYVTA